ncbi:MAG: rhodanese-like domain-containing protein [Acidibacillus sp.]|nr:rhodanese-like domain-containing protein [Acidibacillus sp.]
MNEHRVTLSPIVTTILENHSIDVLDIRSIFDFTQSFIPFSLCIPESEPDFLVHVRKIFPHPRDILVIGNHATIPQSIVDAIHQVGGHIVDYVNFHEWSDGGYPLLSIETMDIEDILEGSSIFIDVRTKLEWENKNIPGSIHIPLSEIRDIAKTMEPTTTYVTYCAGVYRGLNGAALMRSQGLTVRYLVNGLNAWYNNHSK